MMLMNYQHILVGVDGSKAADHAFERAVTVAKGNQATLHVAQIIPDGNFAVSAVGLSANLIAHEKATIQAKLAKKVAFARQSGVQTVESILKISAPRQELTKTLPDEHQIDLIILGTSGQDAIDRFVLGSVAQYASMHAKVDVLLVR